MVHHHRNHQLRKDDDVEGGPEAAHAQRLLIECGKKNKPRLLPMLFVFSIISCSLVFAPRLSYLAFSYVGSLIGDGQSSQPCSSPDASDYLCCDRTGFRSDICFMQGDIRTSSATSSVLLYSSPSSNATRKPEERKTGETHIKKIKPYTRKWETSVMGTIDELSLVKTTSTADATQHPCDVHHSVPAVVFSTGGYTGNVYHEFNDGLIPLYITSKHFNKQVVFVILEYHPWWITKYGDILSRLSDYPPVDFFGTNTTHCFSQAIVGLRIHDELSVDPTLMPGNHSILDFRQMLDEAYKPRIKSLVEEEEQEKKNQVQEKSDRPKLVILSRNGSRAITNEAEVVAMAEEIGFRVEVLRPDRTTEMAKIYRALNRSDVMLGVHGAAMTHFLFMRPGTVFIQVIPLGTDWAAETYYGGPAVKLGLKYLGYKIWARESSLYEEYGRDDPVLRDPESVNRKGWQVTKKVYLDGQNVNLHPARFRKRLTRVYMYCVAKRRRGWN